jgi:MFS family permease
MDPGRGFDGHRAASPSLASRISPTIVIAFAQLLGTSLWFSANSAADDLMQAWHVSAADIGWLTSSVQGGFILGTLVIALGGLADRFPASRIFVTSAVAGALFNAGFAWFSTGLLDGAVFRFMVGISLAGIYPLGMKLIVSWAPDRTGAALAQLVAMLTLGTALPHFLRGLGTGLPWRFVILSSSLLALVGALLIYRLGDGPHLPARAKSPLGGAGPEAARIPVLSAFKLKNFRAAALGYFGHMWELYAFWTLVPLLVSHSAVGRSFEKLGVSTVSFCIIAVGAVGCVLGGALSRRIGSDRVAMGALVSSGLCGLLFSLFGQELSGPSLFGLLLLWGATVIADSSQFSALSAQACPKEIVGAALAIQNSIGFAITVVSISWATNLFEHIGLGAAWVLVPGPIVGGLGFVLTKRWPGKRPIAGN